MDFIQYIIIVVIIIIVWATITKLLNNNFEKNKLKNFALDMTGTFIVKSSLDNLIIDINESFTMFTNYDKEDVVNKLKVEDLVSKNSEDNFIDFRSSLYEKNFSKGNISIRTKDNKDINVNVIGKMYKNHIEKGHYIYVFHIVNAKCSPKDELNMNYIESKIKTSFSQEDLQYIKNIERLNTLKERYDSIIDSADIGMLEIDLINNNFYFTSKFREIVSFEGEFEYDNLSKKLINYFKEPIISDDYYKLIKAINIALVEKEKEFKVNIRLCGKEKEIRWIDFFGKIFYEKDKVIKIICIVNDITNSKIYQNKINKLAYSDMLTDLNNRVYMEERADNVLKTFPQEKAALILFDIDDFRFVNDSFGHDIGDKVIKEIGRRMNIISQDKKCIVSRFSGNEMAIFYMDFKKNDEIENYVKELKSILNKNYNELGIAYNIAVSVGIAVSPEHGMKFNELYKHTEIAMKEAKDTGKNKHLFFNTRMKENLRRRVSIENDLRASINSETNLFLYLQPQYEIYTEKLHGFEALIRWKDKSGKFISPNEFIPIAEETRLVIPIGNWILKEACKILKKFEEKGLDDIKISVNLSPVELLDGFLIENMKRTIKESGINPKNLVLEITETAVMENLDSNVKKLFELEKLGLQIALDDFGTGYSSLTYLKILPIDIIKIDKSFVDDITVSKVDRDIIEKIIELSHILNLVTIVEGVETKEQLEFVKEIGCDIVQGFLVSGKPIDARLIEKNLNLEPKFYMYS